MRQLQIRDPRTAEFLDLALDGRSVREMIDSLRLLDAELASIVLLEDGRPAFVFFANGRILGLDDPLQPDDHIVTAGGIFYGG